MTVSYTHLDVYKRQVLVLVLIAGMVGAFLASPFGVFFSNETTQDGMLMRQAPTQLHEESYARIGQIEQANPHDILEIEASDGDVYKRQPLALAGFLTYNGMPLEKFLWAVFKSQVLRARPRVFRAENYWYIFFCEKGRLEKPEMCIRDSAGTA